MKRIKTKKEAHICTVSNILGKYLQRDGLGVVHLFSVIYKTEAKKNKTKKSVAIRDKMRLKESLVIFGVLHTSDTGTEDGERGKTLHPS